MLSLIEVQCPHCSAKGQIVVPPVGSIIIGPCPRCTELVVVFCGQVLALDRATMEDGSLEERREHVVGVLTEFLQDRVHKLMEDQELLEAHALDDGEGEGLLEPEDVSAALGETVQETATEEHASGISSSEMERFIQVDLKLLDNTAYFKSVFDE